MITQVVNSTYRGNNYNFFLVHRNYFLLFCGLGGSTAGKGLHKAASAAKKLHQTVQYSRGTANLKTLCTNRSAISLNRSSTCLNYGLKHCGWLSHIEPSPFQSVLICSVLCWQLWIKISRMNMFRLTFEMLNVKRRLCTVYTIRKKRDTSPIC